ncbi:MAG: transposase [Terriglobia bacterium]
MFLFPYRAQIRLHKWPVVTIAISLLCLAIYLAQAQSESRVEAYTEAFCAQPDATWRRYQLSCAEAMRHTYYDPDPAAVVDGLPAHKKGLVKTYVAKTCGKLTLHFLPGYAPDLNPDELVWSHAKRTGVARSPLKKGEKLQERVNQQLQAIGNNPKLVRSFFEHPSVAYISDY